jgi:hypothetical protein
MRIGAILGGYKNGRLVNAETAAKGAKFGEGYTLFGPDIAVKGSPLKLTKVHDPMMDICPDYYGVETDSKIRTGVALSSSVRWNATPRIPKKIASSNRVYRGIVRKFIEEKGIKRPRVEIKKILRVDLEGDGQDEVLIHAGNRKGRTGFDTKAGEYSFILLRKIVDGRVKNILLAGDIVTKNREGDIPYNYELSSILDLDGDGKMEIVTYGEYYEGSWVEAFQIKAGKANKVLETGCGV